MRKIPEGQRKRGAHRKKPERKDGGSDKMAQYTANTEGGREGGEKNQKKLMEKKVPRKINKRNDTRLEQSGGGGLDTGGNDVHLGGGIN